MALVTRTGKVNINTDVALADAAAMTIYTPLGPAVSYTINASGTGYALNDILTLVLGGASGARIQATAVGGGGEFQGGTLLASGTDYYVATGAAAATTTVSPAGGSGAKFNVTQIDYPKIPITIHKIIAAPLPGIGGAAGGRITLRDGATDIINTGVTVTSPNAAAANTTNSKLVKTDISFIPTTAVSAAYSSITNASTVALSVIWSRGA